MDKKNSFNSEAWWSDISSFADSFIKFINDNFKSDDNKPVIIKIKNLDQVKDTYSNNLYIFKKKFYGKKASEINLLDRHKIIALYIKSFLEESPFYVENFKHSDLAETLKYPNEYFVFELMLLILIAWNEKNEAINMEESEKQWFLGLLNHFRLDLSTLDILSLAQIIYYVEDKYIKSK